MPTTPITAPARSLASAPDKMLKLDDHFGFQKTMSGFERIYKDGQMAIVHGVGYDQPSFSHFSSMAFWQTGAPNSGEAYGWLGRMADSLDPLGHNANFLINIDDHQSLAVRAANHVPLVFDDPDKFTRRMYDAEAAAMAAVDTRGDAQGNGALDFLFDIAASCQPLRTARARGVGGVPDPDRLWSGQLGAGAGGGVDRRRFPDAGLLRALPQQRL